MPQIEIEYSANLPEPERLRAFAVELHRMASPLIASEVESFKTRLSRIDDCVIGDGSGRVAMLHVDFRMLSGRTQDVKSELGQRILEAVVARFSGLADDTAIQVTVEVHDLDRGNYHKRSLGVDAG